MQIGVMCVSSINIVLLLEIFGMYYSAHLGLLGKMSNSLLAMLESWKCTLGNLVDGGRGEQLLHVSCSAFGLRELSYSKQYFKPNPKHMQFIR